MVIRYLLILGSLFPGAVHAQWSEAVDFDQMKRESLLPYEGTPVVGAHKRLQRNLHFAESHLDDQGRVFNFQHANLAAYAHASSSMRSMGPGGDWEPIGPYSMVDEEEGRWGLGRINCFAFQDNDSWLAGSAGGGLWRTDDAGFHWTSISSNLPVLSVSGIVIHPSDPDSIWILTGDGDSWGSSGPAVPGIGVMVTGDGGASWSQTAYTYPENALGRGYKLMALPGNHRVQFACAFDGLYYTEDGWETSSMLMSGTFFDLEFKPGDPSTLYAASNSSVWRSTNAGITFNNITGAMPPFNTGMRTALATTAADPSRLYVMVAQQGSRGLSTFQVSMDEGASFTLLLDSTTNILGRGGIPNDGTGQGGYDLALWADPGNADRVIVGGIDLYRSNDGGSNWTWIGDNKSTGPDYVHADIHAVESIGGLLVIGTDGGVAVGSPIGSTWVQRNQGLNCTQFYDGHIFSNWEDVYEVAAGAQDNGTLMRFVNGSSTFRKLFGGDGFSTFRGKYDGNHVRYLSTQNGRLYVQEEVDVSGWVIDEITPTGVGDGVWHTPYTPNLHNYTEVLAGYRHVMFNPDAVNLSAWDALTVDRPFGSNYEPEDRIRQLRWAYSDRQYVYFHINQRGVEKNDIWVCRDLAAAQSAKDMDAGNCSVFAVDSITGMPDPSVTFLDINSYDPKSLVFTIGGYVDSQKVYINRNTDDGTLFENITYDLPNVPARCARQTPEGIYVGTDIGVFFLAEGAFSWTYYSDGLPPVPVERIAITNTQNKGRQIWAITYGRGIWSGTPAEPGRQTRWYVDADATGLNDGTSWAHAFTDPQDAFDAAQPLDSIWIAEGVYTPGGALGSLNTFTIANPEVHVYGGFQGTESSWDARDPASHFSILSGDIGVEGDSTDNAYSVLTLNGNNGWTSIEDLIVEGGNAPGSGGAIRYSNASGATGKPLLRNLIIRDNYGFHGGGLYVGDFSRGDPTMSVIGCTFERNRGSAGGAVHLSGQSTGMDGEVNMVFQDCLFQDNYATSGSNMYVDATNGGSGDLIVRRSVFQRSEVHFDGAGVYVWTLGGGDVEAEYEAVEFRNLEQAVHNNAQGGTINSTFLNCLFDSCSATYGSAIFNNTLYGGTANARYDSCAFSNNSSFYGTVLHEGKGTASDGAFYACRFTDNTDGSGIVRFNGESGSVEAILDSCSFANNSGPSIRTTTNGSGNVALTLSRGHFQDNTSYAGGAVLLGCAGPTTVRIRQSTFTGNTSTHSGGALKLEGDGVALNSVHLDTCTFTDNQSSDGGALYCTNNSYTATGCIFTGNHASDDGGAIFNNASGGSVMGSITLRNCLFEDNTAVRDGGALHEDEAHPGISGLSAWDCAFRNNSAGYEGGGVYIETNRAGSTELNACHFEGNLAHDGGGLSFIRQANYSRPLDTAYVLLNEVTFQSDSAEEIGGSIRMVASDNLKLDVLGCRFLDNASGDRGGGIHVGTGGGTDPGDAVVRVDRSWFEGNRSLSGGGIYLHTSSWNDTLRAKLSNTVFYRNVADYGAAMRLVNWALQSIMEAELQHITSLDNYAHLEAGFLRSIGPEKVDWTLENSISFGDSCGACSAGQHAIMLGGGAVGTLRSVLIDALPTGAIDGGAVFSGDPVFVNATDPDGPDNLIGSSDDGLQLDEGSAAADAAMAVTLTEDFFGLPRPKGPASDLGAYERESVCNPGVPPSSLSDAVMASGVQLNWDPVPLSVACQLNGRPLGAPGFASLAILGTEVNSAFVPASVLVPDTTYEWKVRCACSISPLLATGFSILDSFHTTGLLRVGQQPLDFRVHPNPTNGPLRLEMLKGDAVTVDVYLTDLLGRQHAFFAAKALGPGEPVSLDLSSLSPGVYLLELRTERHLWSTPILRSQD